MRKNLGAVVVGLGVFLLILGALSRFYAYPKLAVVPLDQFSALPSEAGPDPEDPPTVSEATDATIFSLAEGLVEITTDLVSTRNTIGQVEDSEELNDETGEDLAIYETFSFSQDDQDRILSGTFDRVIFDRNTGEVYHCAEELAELCDEKTGFVKVDPEQTDVEGTIDDIAFVYPGEGTFEGFRGQYFKLPMNTQKTTYTWWDGDIGTAADPSEVDESAWDMVYDGEETLEGLNTYRFVQTIPDTLIGEQEIPGSLVDPELEGNVTVDSMYSNNRTIWVEPETGVLMKGQEEQHNYFVYEGEEVVTTTEALIAYNDATVKDNVDKFTPLGTQLKLVRVWVPLIGLVLGLGLVVLGVFLTLRARSRESSDANLA